MDTTRGGGELAPLASLGIEKGPGAGTSLAITRPSVTIGKSTQNEVVIDDDSISTRHARLDYRDGGWTLTDLSSANGTWVNGVRLAPDVPAALDADASVRFGGVQAVFRPSPDADVAASRAAPAEPPPRTRVADRRTGVRFPVWLLLVIVLIIAAIWFGLVWQPEPEPTPAADQPAIGVIDSPGEQGPPA